MLKFFRRFKMKAWQRKSGPGSQVQRLDARHVGGIMGGLVGSLCTYFDPDEVRDALIGLAEPEEFWKTMRQHYQAHKQFREWEK